jgi:hypothetical protein
MLYVTPKEASYLIDAGAGARVLVARDRDGWYAKLFVEDSLVDCYSLDSGLSFDEACGAAREAFGLAVR